MSRSSIQTSPHARRGMRRRPLGELLLGLPALLLLAACSEQACVGDQWSEPLPGVKYLRRRTNEPVRVHAVVIDLCRPGVSARATAPGEGPSTVSEFAKKVGADVAVNGDFFGEGYIPLGLAVGSGRRWPQTRDLKGYALMAFADDRVWMPRAEERVDRWFEHVEQVVGGRPSLMRGGEVVAPSEGALCANRHPRTAVGISQDGGRLILAVVDGRSVSSRGLTCRELAELMEGLGAHHALNLDGGGSSALWIRGLGVVNRPSDGQERPVANHLAFLTSAEGAPTHCPADLREAEEEPEPEEPEPDKD